MEMIRIVGLCLQRTRPDSGAKSIHEQFAWCVAVHLVPYALLQNSRRAIGIYNLFGELLKAVLNCRLSGLTLFTYFISGVKKLPNCGALCSQPPNWPISGAVVPWLAVPLSQAR